MIRMNGNFERLHTIAAGLERLASEGVRDAEHRASVAVFQTIEKQFAAGESAEGEKWAPLAKGGPSHLQDTGKMKRSLGVRGIGRGISVTIDKPAGYHQGGTRRMPARPIAPVNASPSSWDEAVKNAVREVVVQTIRGAAGGR